MEPAEVRGMSNEYFEIQSDRSLIYIFLGLLLKASGLIIVLQQLILIVFDMLSDWIYSGTID